MPGGPRRLEANPSQPLRDRLFDLGVEFPCGGMSQCGGCRIRVLEGEVPVTPEMRAALKPEELDAGWRLACHAEAQGAVTLDIEPWSVPVLSDQAEVGIEPRPGLGAVVDVGTTTVAAQLVDLRTGEILGVETALNVQARYGADIMSRIGFALREPGTLTRLIRGQIEGMLAALNPQQTPVREILLVGNTAMHHLTAGLSVEPLAAVPFRSPRLAAQELELCGWPAVFLGCAGGFVGSDLLAGLCAVGMLETTAPQALIDLGTNGEIAVGNRDGIVVASAAAGPAFEGGRIRQGMRAGRGAIDQVSATGGSLVSRVIGGGAGRGLCGSGLVDAVAAALELGWLQANGRLRDGRLELALSPSVRITQRDIRELQLAKAAVAAGLKLLAGDTALDRLYLAGAFGNYVRASSARRIGLLPPGGPEPKPAGNTALRGARLLLLAPARRQRLLRRIAGGVRHVELATLPHFQQEFVEAMLFPEPPSGNRRNQGLGSCGLQVYS